MRSRTQVSYIYLKKKKVKKFRNISPPLRDNARRRRRHKVAYDAQNVYIHLVGYCNLKKKKNREMIFQNDIKKKKKYTTV